MPASRTIFCTISSITDRSASRQSDSRRDPPCTRPGTRRPGRTRVALAAVALFALTASLPARASDFWDEVRTPGLRSYRALVKEAESALRSGNYGKALEKAESAVGRMNDRAPAHVIRGLALGDLKQYAKAVEAFEQALLLDGSALDDIEQGAEAAQVATRAGAYELAKRLLSRVLGRASNSPLRSGLYAVQGDILQLLGPEQLSAAVLAYRSALRNGTAGAKTPVLLGLALALHREGKPEQAVELAAQAGSRMAVERALRSLPLPPSERAARMAVLLESLGDLEGAVRAWSTATGGGPWADHARGALARLQAAAREAGGSR